MLRLGQFPAMVGLVLLLMAGWASPLTSKPTTTSSPVSKPPSSSTEMLGGSLASRPPRARRAKAASKRGKGQGHKLDSYLFRKRPLNEEPSESSPQVSLLDIFENICDESNGHHTDDKGGWRSDLDVQNAVGRERRALVLSSEDVKHIMRLRAAGSTAPAIPSARSGVFLLPLTPAQAKVIACETLGKVDQELALQGGAATYHLRGNSTSEPSTAKPVTQESTATLAVSTHVSLPGSRLASKGSRASDVQGKYVCSSKVRHVTKDDQWEGQLVVTGATRFVGMGGVSMMGGWSLQGVGGMFEAHSLSSRYGSCLNIESGSWSVVNCSVCSAGLSVVYDSVAHNTMNSAVYCTGSITLLMQWCQVGGIDLSKQASWGVFLCAEANAVLENTFVRLWKDNMRPKKGEFSQNHFLPGKGMPREQSFSFESKRASVLGDDYITSAVNLDAERLGANIAEVSRKAVVRASREMYSYARTDDRLVNSMLLTW